MDNPRQNSRTALIAGATGLIGSALLDQLLASERYHNVIAIGRRKISREHPKLHNVIVDFDHLEQLNPGKVNDVYCCLGTTIKKAGSAENFRRVDYDYVMNLSGWAEANDVARLILISAIGADANSRILYSRVKGEVERDIQKLNIREIHIFRPSLLLGDRKEFRLGERIGAGLTFLVTPLLSGKLAKYHPIEDVKLARAMYCAAFQKEEGIHWYEYPLISELVNTKVC